MRVLRISIAIVRQAKMPPRNPAVTLLGLSAVILSTILCSRASAAERPDVFAILAEGKSWCQHAKISRVGYRPWYWATLILNPLDFNVQGSDPADAATKLFDAIFEECRDPRYDNARLERDRVRRLREHGQYEQDLYVDSMACIQVAFDCLHKDGPGALSCVRSPPFRTCFLLEQA